ncbi:MAG: ComEC/Rec2 family competence protein, partial [Bacilli bacterium]|nr:ComEC/Rec2 family competence protein [Bacilli bacterium]
DIISLCFIFLILFNPYFMYDYGFVLSFLASLVIILLSPLISKLGHFRQLLVISFFASLITLPVVININNDINLLCPITNVIFIDLIEGIILPLSLIIFMIPALSGVYEYMVIGFEKITIFISDYLYIPLRLPDFNFFSMIIYYLLLITVGLFYHKKTIRKSLIVTIVCFILLLSNQKFFQVSGEVNFLDLVNGEAILIETPHSECTALIDTGDGSNNDVNDFLKSRAIKKIDYLFITHNHIDHNGAFFTIIKDFSVKNIVISAYDNSVIGNYPNTIRVKAGDRISCGKTDFLIYHPDQSYSDENDNSLVIHTKLGNKEFLFLGDAGEKIEEQLLNYQLTADIIKIGHHGSATATSPVFIAALRPETAIIQTGRIEKFGFPHNKTIATLEKYNVKIYRTDKNFSVKYRYRKNESIFESIR